MRISGTRSLSRADREASKGAGGETSEDADSDDAYGNYGQRPGCGALGGRCGRLALPEFAVVSEQLLRKSRDLHQRGRFAASADFRTESRRLLPADADSRRDGSERQWRGGRGLL
jgi:hypothetical protein